jgi:Xaa-Pro aminopeptidase
MSASDPRIRAEVESRHRFAAELLKHLDREALLLVDPANVAWVTVGAVSTNANDEVDPPAIYLMPSHRWVVCSNLDTQWLFDTDLNGLGFNVKEWSWSFGRAALISEMVTGRRVASDRPFNGSQLVGAEWASERQKLTELELERLRSLGEDLAHCIEATGRNFARGDTEAEVAGHLLHRLVHRGLTPVSIVVSADGRLRKYRRHAPTMTRVEQTCVIQATAKRYGLHATSSRAVSFGPPPDPLRREMECACRWTAVLMAACVTGAQLADVWDKGMKYLQTTAFEHEWRYMPVGWLTGYRSVEQWLVPTNASRALANNTPIVWQGNIGAVTCADTMLATPDGPRIMTGLEFWPMKRIKVAGITVDRPDILIRES